MKTLQDRWREYRDAVYPNGVPAQQNLECHQAFMASALSFNQATDEVAAIAEKSEDQAMAALAKLKNEVWEINAHRAHVAKARN